MGKYFGGGLIYMICTPVFPPAPPLCNSLGKIKAIGKQPRTKKKSGDRSLSLDKCSRALA